MQQIDNLSNLNPEIQNQVSGVDNQNTIYQYNNQMQQFNIDQFKTQQCLDDAPKHNKKHCIFYHNENDRRRNPQLFQYKCDFCVYGRDCPLGDECDLSHNKVEQLYHPNRYKTKYCQSDQETCEYGVFCTFAHGDLEINIPLKLHLIPRDNDFWMYYYKTIWCPCIENHDRAQCVYAHNAQDFRRDPLDIEYNNIDCPNWNKSQSVTSYEQGGCKDMYNCKNCHGWKELEYHILNYKMKRCSYGQGCTKRNNDCAYYHDTDKRNIGQMKNKNGQNGEQRTENSIKYIKQFKGIKNSEQERGQKSYHLNKQSNFIGPITTDSLNFNPDFKNHKKRLNIGQPFEVFSYSSTTGQTQTVSRKMSDVEQKNIQIQLHLLSQKQNQSNKKNRTAPNTPGQYVQQTQKQLLSQQQLQPIHYSSQFLNLLQQYKVIEIIWVYIFFFRNKKYCEFYNLIKSKKRDYFR